MSTKVIKVGTVQMSCTKNPPENLNKAIERIREAAAKGAQIVCLQELFTSLYFCDIEDYENFKLAEPIPGPSTERLSRIAKELGVVIIASLFEKERKESIIIQRPCWMQMAHILVSIEKCTFRMTLHTMKSFILRPVTLDTRPSRQSLQRLES